MDYLRGFSLAQKRILSEAVAFIKSLIAQLSLLDKKINILRSDIFGYKLRRFLFKASSHAPKTGT